jgi:hypothetical protein
MLSTWRKQVGEYNCNFRGNLRPNCTLLYPKNRESMQIQDQIKWLLDAFAWKLVQGHN